MTQLDKIYKLNLFDSTLLTHVTVYPVGTHIFRASTAGNSVLSTIWVKSLDPGASVVVKYFDFGPGDGKYPGEKIYLTQHKTINTADKSDRILVSRLHNKVFCEAEVIGGNVEFGIYITVAGADPQLPPYLDGQTANLLTDGASASVIYDEVENKFYLVRGTQGVTDVNVLNVGITGKLFTLRNKIETDGTTQTVIDVVVPANKIYRLLWAKFLSTCFGRGDIIVDGDIVDACITDASEINGYLNQNPYLDIDSGKTLQLKFQRLAGASTDVETIVRLTEIDK